MSKYRRLTKGLNDKGKLIPVDADPYKFVTDKNKDWYLSIYKYNEDQKRIITKPVVNEKGKKTIQGVSGIEDVTTNMLVFDVDTNDVVDKLDEVKKDAIKICERLDSMGIPFAEQNISFSGGKGFSIVMFHDKELSPTEHKSIAESVTEGIESFDPKNYNASRIFRLDATKHNKTGLYKTPLSFEELRDLSISEIKEIAKEQYEVGSPIKTTLPEKIYNLRATKKEKTEATKENIKKAIDFTKKPAYLTDVKYALHKGYIPPGHGNEGMMILASTYKNVGFDELDAYHMLKGVNEKRAEIYGIEKRDNNDIWLQVIKTVYSDAWRGGMYSPAENELLQKTATEFNISDKANIVQIGQVRDRFLDFALNINKNIIRTGIKSLDETIMITTGMMVGVLAAPSAGKTSLATQIVESLSKSEQNVLFHSLDMHDTLLYQRLAQRVSGLDIASKLRQMIDTDKTYDPEYSLDTDMDVNKAFDKVDKTFGNVNFEFTRGCTIESIEESIKVQKAKYGENLKMVVVDYLEKVRGPYSDATANSGYVASRLSDLASTYDVAIILLLQPQKSAGDPSEELLSMRKVKGASVIEQDCRVILTMWRPGFSPKMSADDHYASIAVVKNNMGPVCQIDFGWDGLRGQFTELSQAERDDLKRIKEAKEEEKKEKNGWDSI